MANEIHVLNGALEKDADEFDQDCLRGTIDQECLRWLNTDWYQRLEGFSEKEIRELTDLYFAHKKVTDIILGMRGGRFRKDGADFWLIDKVYIIDGVQRWHAARLALDHRPDLKLRLGAKIYFNTTAESENAMFCAMNATQQRVSASVLVRNKYKTSAAAKLLYELNRNNDFALKDCIGWNQRLNVGEVFSGFTLGCIAGALHMDKGGQPTGAAYDLLEHLDKVAIKITPEVMSQNLIGFFDAVDTCWSIRGHKKPECLNREFLCVLARLFSSYENFWDGNEFYLAPRYQKKLAKVDSESIRTQVKQLTKSNVDTKDVLFEVLRKRLDLDAFSGRRTPPKDKTAGARARP
jgi:hypothetical protein